MHFILDNGYSGEQESSHEFRQHLGKFLHRKESSMPSRILWALLLSIGMVVSASPALYAQSTYGSIAGSVTDTSGAVVTDAK